MPPPWTQSNMATANVANQSELLEGAGTILTTGFSTLERVLPWASGRHQIIGAVELGSLAYGPATLPEVLQARPMYTEATDLGSRRIHYG